MAGVSGGGGAGVAPTLPTGDGPVGVRLLVSLSGTRDGVEWPPAGSVAVIPGPEARDMVASGLAVVVDGGRESATAQPSETAAAPLARKRAAKRAEVAVEGED